MQRKLMCMLAAGALFLGSPAVVALATEAGSVLLDERYYETGLPGVTMQGTGTLFYEVSHQGAGQGRMEVSGNATGAYEVVVQIVKTGVIGEAEYQLSLDGGVTYIGQDVVAESCKIGDAGLKLEFSTEQDTMEFIAGDIYSVSVPETFPVVASKASDANVIVMGHPMEDHEIVVSVLSSGGLGEARFTVSTSGQKAVADIIPGDGVYELEDGLQLVFSNSLNYEKGLTYTVSVKSNDETISYMPLYILIGVVAAAGVVVLSLLSGKKEKASDYRLHVYKGKKDRYD